MSRDVASFVAGELSVLRRVAQLDWVACHATYCDARCHFCGAESLTAAPVVHAPDCLWVEALTRTQPPEKVG